MMALLSGLFCYRTRSKTIVMPRLDLGIHGIGLVTSDGCLATSHATRPGRPLRDCVDTRLKAWHDGTLCALLAALALLPSLAFAQVPPQLDHLQRADGTRVVPDHFLRSWDPGDAAVPLRHRARRRWPGGPSGAVRHPLPRQGWRLDLAHAHHAAIPSHRTLAAAAPRDRDARRRRDDAGAAAAGALRDRPRRR